VTCPCLRTVNMPLPLHVGVIVCLGADAVYISLPPLVQV